MHAEIIAIGTEITSGAKLDTNSQWLSERLGELGISTRYHTSVADDMAANVEVLKLAIDRADVVLITGGLGPTLDDLTRQALAEALGVGLVEDAESLVAIEAIFSRRGRPMPASNRIQATFPAGASPLPNPVGTAPGIWCAAPRAGRSPCRIAAFPGVPSEMKPMFKTHVEGRLAGDVCLRRAVINCFGLGESQTEELLGDLTRRGADPEVGITAHDATISLRIIAQGATPEDCQRKIAVASNAVRTKLGNYVFGVDHEEPEHVVVRLLAEQKRTVATCEGATNGDLVRRLLEVPGAGDVSRGGLMLTGRTDWNELIGLPGVPVELTTRSVGQALAKRMARATRLRFKSDYGIAVSPWGTMPVGPDQPPVPTTWVAIADDKLEWAVEARQTGNPAIFAARTAKTALDLLRRRLLGLPSEG
jgi:nicotinamide-nucleotide amidase